MKEYQIGFARALIILIYFYVMSLCMADSVYVIIKSIKTQLCVSHCTPSSLIINNEL